MVPVAKKAATKSELSLVFDMKVSEQCGIAASKGNQILGLIRRIITYKEKQLIVPLYNGYIWQMFVK